MLTKTNKPYFCPVMKVYFYKIESGEQDCEIRPLNHRGWNLKNIFKGRDILFSNGYGKHNRVLKKVHTVLLCSELSEEFPVVPLIPQWHIDAVKKIYPWAEKWLVAYV